MKPDKINHATAARARSAAPPAPALAPVCASCAGTGRRPLPPEQPTFSRAAKEGRGRLAELKRVTGYASSTISRALAGETRMPLDMAVALAGALGMSVDQFIRIPRVARRLEETRKAIEREIAAAEEW